MNPLEEFEEKLYKRKEEETKKRKTYETYQEKDSVVTQEWWEEKELEMIVPRRTTYHVTLTLLLALFCGLVVYGYYWYTTDEPFSTTDVKIGITHPAQITAGDEVHFSVLIRNTTSLALQETDITLIWPEGTAAGDTSLLLETGQKTKKTLGTLLPGQEKEVIFRAKIYGSKDTIKKGEMIIHYRPDGLPSLVEKREEFSVSIIGTPLALHLKLPTQAASEKEIEMTLEYTNQSESIFNNIILQATYPTGFTFISAVPPPHKTNNIWQLDKIVGKGSGVIVVKGSFSGVSGESRLVSFNIVSEEKKQKPIIYAHTEESLLIASSALFIFQTVNDSRDFIANTGETLHYKIRYKNTTTTAIPQVVIIAKLDNKYLNIKSLKIPWGSFYGRTNSIIWNGEGVKDLAILDPQEEGEVSFSINVNPSFIPKTETDKNISITSHAKITSSVPPDTFRGLPIDSEDEVKIKINTQFSFHETAYWGEGLIPNTGTLPPRVGQRNTFAISWQLSNSTNDVDAIEVSAKLPPHVSWTGVVLPENAPLVYDENSGIIVWKPGIIIPAGTGFFNPVKRVDFQVAFTPLLADVGRVIPLLSAASLIATDIFTHTTIERQAQAIASDLLGTLTENESRVSE